MSEGGIGHPCPVEASPAEPAHRCALCGHAFGHGAAACAGCPMGAGCDLMECPNCGYRFPVRSRTVDWFRRRFRRRAGS